jgi:RNA polymerase sigma-70 factor (ECF subfamily)
VFTFSNKSYSSFTDEELMLYVSQGKEKAFTELYHRYARRMLYFFYQRLYQDEQKAQDFLQDLFLKILEKQQLFDGSKKFKTWIYTLAANQCKNEYRKDAVRGLKVTDFVLDDMPENLSALILPDRFDKNLFATNLKTELNKLDENHRLTFLLRYQEEFSINEISEILGCAEGTVKSRLFYCTKKLALRLRAFNPQNELE